MGAKAPQTGDLYEIILRVAAFPVLLLLIALAWLITNYLMNPRWKQERRNRQIRKAVAARQTLRAESMSTAMANNSLANNTFSAVSVTSDQTLERMAAEQKENSLSELKNRH